MNSSQIANGNSPRHFEIELSESDQSRFVFSDPFLKTDQSISIVRDRHLNCTCQGCAEDTFVNVRINSQNSQIPVKKPELARYFQTSPQFFNLPADTALSKLKWMSFIVKHLNQPEKIAQIKAFIHFSRKDFPKLEKPMIIANHSVYFVKKEPLFKGGKSKVKTLHCHGDSTPKFAAKIITVTENNKSNLEWEADRNREFNNHPGITPCIAQFTHQKTNQLRKYIAIYPLRYSDLWQLLYRNFDVSISETAGLDMIRQIANTLLSMKKSHGDLKPDNCLVEPDDPKQPKQFTVELTDLECCGIAEKGEFCGTPIWAAPEILNRSVSEPGKVDVWPLGLILYQLMNMPKTKSRDSTWNPFFPWQMNTRLTRDRIRPLIRRDEIAKFVEKLETRSDIKELLLSMLEIDPEKRCTMDHVNTQLKEILTRSSSEKAESKSQQ